METPPTVASYPGLELAGLRGGTELAGFRGVLDPVRSEIEAFIQRKLDETILPQVRAESAKGAEAAVRPLVIASGVLAGTALVLSIIALTRKKG